MELPAHVQALCRDLRSAEGPLVFLTGAGISAASGIPTFRGPEGYWRVGSRNYRPEEIATWQTFARRPDEVWAWYLYRIATCRAATPNPAHAALVQLEELLGPRFLLVTQNVDGLHRRAGNSAARCYEVHGNIDHVRCTGRCADLPRPLPEVPGLGAWGRDQPLGPVQAELLQCADCGSWLRPHVLWFDEYYDEEKFRFESSIDAALRAAALVVVGSSGSTNLPLQMAERAAARRTPLLVIDPEPSIFSQLARAQHGSQHLRGPATTLLPLLLNAFEAGPGGG